MPILNGLTKLLKWMNKLYNGQMDIEYGHMDSKLAMKNGQIVKMDV